MDLCLHMFVNEGCSHWPVVTFLCDSDRCRMYPSASVWDASGFKLTPMWTQPWQYETMRATASPNVGFLNLKKKKLAPAYIQVFCPLWAIQFYYIWEINIINFFRPRDRMCLFTSNCQKTLMYISRELASDGRHRGCLCSVQLLTKLITHRWWGWFPPLPSFSSVLSVCSWRETNHSWLHYRRGSLLQTGRRMRVKINPSAWSFTNNILQSPATFSLHVNILKSGKCALKQRDKWRSGLSGASKSKQ